MALMFQATARLKKAVSLINDIDASKYPLVLSRIIQKLHMRDERPFSDEEEEKLQGALGIDADSLHAVLETSAFLLEQAAYHNAKPAILKQQLENISLAEDKVEAIVSVWSANSRSVIEKLKHRSLAPKQLDSVNWRLNLQMAQANMAKMKLPNAMFELQLSSSGQTQEKIQEKIQVEFTHEELYKFYNQLETIQSQLDSLS